jgi:RND family efflux transporter MFP subunit
VTYARRSSPCWLRIEFFQGAEPSMRSKTSAVALYRALLGSLSLALAFSAQAQQRPAAVEITHAQMRELSPSVRATGVVQSRAAADLAAAVAGRIQSVADPGTTVQANDIVARLDVTDVKLVRAEQAARVTRAEVSLQSLDRELERLKASGSAVSRVQLDTAQSTRDLAAADLEVARATLAQTDEQLAHSELHAPFAGVVSERVKRVGEEVARGDVVARLVNPDELEIRLFVPLRHVRAVRAGDVVNVTAEGHPFTAKVRAIVPAGDARSQSFEVLVSAPAVDGLLAPGNTVDVELPLGTPQQQIAVPRDALVIRAEGVFVYRVNGESKAEKVSVKPGIADGDWVGIEGAINPNDQVIVRGAELLRGDETVQVVGVIEQEAKLVEENVNKKKEGG